MDEWTITHKPSYDRDFIDLSKDLQHKAVNAVSRLEVDPATTRSDVIKALQGWKNVYRYRLGDHRLIYALHPSQPIVQLLAIGPRGKIYDRFNYAGWDGPEATAIFGPELADDDAFQMDPEWFRPKAQPSEPLPKRLTPTLLTGWGIDESYHAALVGCRTEDDLYDLDEAVVPGEVQMAVVDRLYPSTASQLAIEPDLRLFDAEDLMRYAEGTLTGFLLHLDDQQEPLTRFALRGPTLVKGGPGSGKSTVALYRLRALVEHYVREHGRPPDVLFTTYTNSLVNFSESLLGQLLSDLAPDGRQGEPPSTFRISTLHKTALWAARSSGQPFTIASEWQRREALHAGLAAVRPKGLGDAALIPLHRAVEALRDDYLLEEFDWVVEGQDCRDEAAYLAADRSGRGIPFTETRRRAVWRVYETYLTALVDRGCYSWGHIIQVALDQVRSGAFRERWDYVVVDEAQDLPPAALSLAVELASHPSGVFLTADANQSLYNRGFRWTNVHEDLNVAGRTRILRRNYRSTRQVAAAAADILAPVSGVDKDVIQQEFVHSGPKPIIYAGDGMTDQWRWIAEQIYAAARQLRLPVNAAAVLVSSGVVGEPLAAALSDHGLPARFMNSKAFDLDEPCIKVTTLHAAKGLEFPIVVVAHVEAGRLPIDSDAIDMEELAVHEESQRRLFFVGCTRAMRHLFVTYDRAMASPFIADLSETNWLRA